MRYSTLHTHTIFSDGKHMPEDNVLSAIAKNMVSIGFSDHSYTDFKLDCCIKPVTTPAYIAEIRRLQKNMPTRSKSILVWSMTVSAL